MYEFEPYFTADGSTGLYNKDIDDIYHSADGALTESYEKFVLPIDFDNLFKNDEIKVLDICYGLGYNSKSFLNYLFQNKSNFLKIKKNQKNLLQKKFSDTHYTETIHDDKNLSNRYINIEKIHNDNIKDNSKNNVSIHNDNGCKHCNCEPMFFDNISEDKSGVNANFAKVLDKFIIEFISKFNNHNKLFKKIYIDAVDTDRILALLSPFIKTDGICKKNEEIINSGKIKKFLSKINLRKYTLDPNICKLLLYSMLLNSSYQNCDELYNLINNKKYMKYLISDIRRIFNFICLFTDKLSKVYDKNSFLHNI